MQEYIKKTLVSGTSILIISNDEMEDIMKIVKSPLNLFFSWFIIKRTY